MIDRRQAALGLAALLAGMAVYLIDRPAGQLSGAPHGWHLWDGRTHLLGRVGGILPDFLHVFGFSVVTGSLLEPGLRRYLAACGTWALIDVAFETGQHPVVAAWIEASLPPQNSRNSISVWTVEYFRNGTFDPLDILAILAGAAAALWLLSNGW
jgi:hypothetical protein